jgi:hypothetical protein
MGAGGKRYAFFMACGAAAALTLSAVASLHLLLGDRGLLPPPPLTATTCMDARFAEYFEGVADDASLVAMGSSATWRNLMLDELARRTGETARNLSMCYMHIDQTAYLADFLLPRLRAARTILVLLHPRDFENCPPEETAFFNRPMADGIVDGAVPKELLYATGISPAHLLTSALERTTGTRLEVVTDGRGSEILASTNDWRPPFDIDPRCFSSLSVLESAVRANAKKLVLVLIPLEPSWLRREDPEGEKFNRFQAQVASNIGADTRLIDLSQAGFASSEFADPVHFLPPGARRLTGLIADRLAAAH